MAITKYFSDVNGTTVELKSAHPLDNKKFEVAFPGVKGKRWDSFSRMVGDPIDFVTTFDREASVWTHDYRPVTRVISRKSNPSNHKCDARCMNAKGSNCECSCGGDNHGAGNFSCD